MPRIILKQPFIHHYAGSIFELSDAIGYSDWDDDERVRDRVYNFDKRSYHLPDDGKGNPVFLPVHYTMPVEDNILFGLDVKSGPCRITMVSNGLNASEDPYYQYPTPQGKGRLTFKNTSGCIKNTIGLLNPSCIEADEAIIWNVVASEKKNVPLQKLFTLCFDDFLPGFYHVDLLYVGQIVHHFKLIKCFPVVVEIDHPGNKYSTIKTIW